MADVVTQLEQMWALLLRTTKPGTWYAGHAGAAGYWSQAEALKDAAIAELTAAPPVPSAANKVPHVWDGSDWADSFDYSRSDRYAAFIAHSSDSWASQGARYKAANSPGQCLAYQNFGTANDGISTVLSAASARSDGFLAHHGGAEIPNPWNGDPNQPVVDLGKPGVGAAYVQALRTKLLAHPWDGVFADDANAWFNLWADGQSIDGYSSPADYWARAMLPLLTTVAASFAVVPNIGDWAVHPELKGGALACFGGLEEHFLVWEDATSLPPAYVENQHASARACIAAGKVYHGIFHRTDAAGLKYAWAMAAIMAGDRLDLFRLACQTSYGSAPPAWSAAFDVDLGAALSGASHVAGSAAWSRSFANGSVAANTSTQAGTFP